MAAKSAKKKTKGAPTPKSAKKAAPKAKAKAKMSLKPAKATPKVAAKAGAKKAQPAVATKANGKSPAAVPAVKGGKKSKLTMADNLNAIKSKITGNVQKRTLLSDGSDAVCREVACEGLGTTGGYCRLHYIKNWKKVKRKEVILKERKLNGYIEELVAKYPDKYIDAIRLDLASDKEFAKVIADLDLDESIDDFEGEGEGDEVIEGIRREFDDDSDAF